MRRWFALLLLVVLSLQLPWAAAAKVCAHDDRAAGVHFGHHEHAHAAGGEGQAAADHADCGVCHLTCAKAMKSPLDLPSPAALGARRPPADDAGYASAPGRPLERPNWSRAA